MHHTVHEIHHCAVELTSPLDRRLGVHVHQLLSFVFVHHQLWCEIDTVAGWLNTRDV
jgi:hypothetical protein